MEFNDTFNESIYRMSTLNYSCNIVGRHADALETIGQFSEVLKACRAEHFPNDLATRPRLYLNRNLTESTISSL